MRIPVHFRPGPLRPRRPAFTLVELLVATTLSLVILGIMSYMFGSVTKSVNEQRSAIEVRQQLRAVANQLRQDLEGITLVPKPKIDPASESGYFEYVEGPYGAVYDPRYRAPMPSSRDMPYTWTDTTRPTTADSFTHPDDTLGDADDVLMFTSRNLKSPFRGRGTGLKEGAVSPEAEIIYFVRGTNLYRRVLLVGVSEKNGMSIDSNAREARGLAPSSGTLLPFSVATSGRDATKDSFYMDFDLSVREEPSLGQSLPSANSVSYVTKLNTLGDLTKRENRYAHQPTAFPHHVREWGPLGMPTVGECSHRNWRFPEARREGVTGEWWGGLTSSNNGGAFDRGLGRNDPLGFNPRLNAVPWNNASVNPYSGQLVAFTDVDNQATLDQTGWYGRKSRTNDDLVMGNVLAFDVKIWDPEAPVYTEANASGADAAVVIQGDPAYMERVVSNATPAAYGSFVDLNYNNANPSFSWFSGPGDGTATTVNAYLRAKSVGSGATAYWLPATYDTVPTHYDYDGFKNDSASSAAADGASNGVDDNANGIPDDPAESEFIPPYNRSPRGVQIKIRVFEPSTNEIREATIVHYFVKG